MEKSFGVKKIVQVLAAILSMAIMEMKKRNQVREIIIKFNEFDTEVRLSLS